MLALGPLAEQSYHQPWQNTPARFWLVDWSSRNSHHFSSYYWCFSAPSFSQHVSTMNRSWELAISHVLQPPSTPCTRPGWHGHHASEMTPPIEDERPRNLASVGSAHIPDAATSQQHAMGCYGRIHNLHKKGPIRCWSWCTHDVQQHTIILWAQSRLMWLQSIDSSRICYDMRDWSSTHFSKDVARLAIHFRFSWGTYNLISGNPAFE